MLLHRVVMIGFEIAGHAFVIWLACALVYGGGQ